MMNWLPIYGGWMNADGTSELIQLRCDDGYDRKAAFKIHKAILNAYCAAQLVAGKLQSNGQNKKEEYA